MILLDVNLRLYAVNGEARNKRRRKFGWSRWFPVSNQSISRGPLGIAGNLTSDAHLAALAIEHGAQLCSADSDFARFPGLKWMNPLA